MTDGIWIHLEPRMALHMIAEPGCEYITNPALGQCFTKDRRHPFARDGADQACHACIAWLALQERGVEVPTL